MSSAASRLFSDEDLIEALDRARICIPSPEDWGVYAYDDGPVIAGGGFGGLLWDPSVDAVLDLLIGYGRLFKSLPESCTDVVAELRGQLQASARPDAMPTLNELMKGSLQIVWCGQLADLLHGRSKFAAEIRTWFRRQANPAERNGLPLNSSEQENFVRSLQHFGL